MDTDIIAHCLELVAERAGDPALLDCAAGEAYAAGLVEIERVNGAWRRVLAHFPHALSS